MIHKNIGSINKMLNEIKHLVVIKPLRFPDGLPEHESDFEHTRITSDGEIKIVKRLAEYEPAADQVNPEKEKWKMDQETVKKELDKKLVDFNVHTEYFKNNYVYRRNQDGKEYRYNRHKDVPKYEW